MALDTVSLSDIGQSLVAIEAEITSNLSTVKYYSEQIAALKLKNETLHQVGKALLVNSIPKLMDF